MPPSLPEQTQYPSDTQQARGNQGQNTTTTTIIPGLFISPDPDPDPDPVYSPEQRPYYFAGSYSPSAHSLPSMSTSRSKGAEATDDDDGAGDAGTETPTTTAMAAQYPDDMNRQQPYPRNTEHLRYSPVISSSPAMPDSAKRPSRPADVDSLFEDSGSEDVGELSLAQETNDEGEQRGDARSGECCHSPRDEDEGAEDEEHALHGALHPLDAEKPETDDAVNTTWREAEGVGYSSSPYCAEQQADPKEDQTLRRESRSSFSLDYPSGEDSDEGGIITGEGTASGNGFVLDYPSHDEHDIPSQEAQEAATRPSRLETPIPSIEVDNDDGGDREPEVQAVGGHREEQATASGATQGEDDDDDSSLAARAQQIRAIETLRTADFDSYVDTHGHAPDWDHATYRANYERYLEIVAQARRDSELRKSQTLGQGNRIQSAAAEDVDAAGDGDAETEEETTHEGCECSCKGNTLACKCHPEYCPCDGCDHTEQIEEMYREATRKWGEEGDGDQTAGPRVAGTERQQERAEDQTREPEQGHQSRAPSDTAPQPKCICIPGRVVMRECKVHWPLVSKRAEARGPCACAGACDTDSATDGAAEAHGQGQQRSGCHCPSGKCACVDCRCHGNHSAHASQARKEIYNAFSEDTEKEYDRLLTRHDSGRGEYPHPIGPQTADAEPMPCYCRVGAQCYCAAERCLCRKTMSQPEPRMSSQADKVPRHPDQTRFPCECREPGVPCGCFPRSRCRDAQSAPEPSTELEQLDDQRSEEMFNLPTSAAGRETFGAPSGRSLGALRGMGSLEAPRNARSKILQALGDDIGQATTTATAQESSQTQSQIPGLSSILQSSMVPQSRPDTPRPPASPETLPFNPYGPDELQDIISEGFVEPQLPSSPLSFENDDVRQSVEPELPPANWERESTPAYEDRSFTPSPMSRRGEASDVEMRDVSDGFVPSQLRRDGSVSPSDSPDLRSPSPRRPVPPPIPDDSPTPLKQPKRGDRRQSGVQGSKVGKRSTTGAKSKSRNVTRKPTTSVAKLVGAAKQAQARHDAETASHTKPLPKVAVGKVAAAVKKIEQDVRKELEEQGPKVQKDGTPVRRSRRANKGVRTSFGYSSPG